MTGSKVVAYQNLKINSIDMFFPLFFEVFVGFTKRMLSFGNCEVSSFLFYRFLLKVPPLPILEDVFVSVFSYPFGSMNNVAWLMVNSEYDRFLKNPSVHLRGIEIYPHGWSTYPPLTSPPQK